MEKKEIIIRVSFVVLFFTVLWIAFYFGDVLDVSHRHWYSMPYYISSIIIIIVLFILSIAALFADSDDEND